MKSHFNFSIVSAAKFIGFVFAVTMLFGTHLTIAQQLTSRPDQGMMGKETQQVSNIDSINLQNGGVTLDIPLASLPPIAGGKLSYTLSAHYNSKLWTGFRSEVNGTTSSPGCPPVYSTEEILASDTGGWHIGGTYAVILRDATEDYAYLAPSSQSCYGAEFSYMAGHFFKPILITPDGSEHELRIQGSYATYAGDREHLQNYYRYTGTAPFTSATKLYTVDGTYMTVMIDPTSSTNPWTIYMKNGSRVEQNSDGQRIFDINGNSIFFGGNSGGGYSFARDEQTNREIRWYTNSSYNSQPATKVQYQSVGGNWQNVWVVWGTTHVQGKIYSKQDWNPNGGEFHDGAQCGRKQALSDTLNVVRQIIYPATEQGVDPQQYTFSYNSDTSSSVTTSGVSFGCTETPSSYTRTTSTGTGEISEVITPTGSYLNYSYSNDNVHTFGQLSEDGGDLLMRSVITAKTATHDSVVDSWAYNISSSQYANGGVITNPDGSTYTETYSPTDPFVSAFGGTNGLGGLQIKENQSGKVLTEKHWTLLGGNNLYAMGSPSQRISFNPVVDTEYTSLLDGSGNRIKISAKKFEYDYNGDLTKTTDYDWFNPNTVTFTNNDPVNGVPAAVPSGATVLRVTNVSYYNTASAASDSTSYQNRTVGSSTVILGAPKETSVGDGTTVKSLNECYYDGHTDLNTAPSKGNLTKSRSWDDTNNQWVNSELTYSSRGNVLIQKDAKGVEMRYTYGAINGYTDLYPTQTVAAYDTSVARSSSAGYDFYTGLMTSATDVDNSLSVTTEYDILGRPTKIRNAAGTVLESWVRNEYSDSNRRVIVRADLEAMGDGRKVAIHHYDQAGRLRLARTLENAATENPYNEASGIKVETKYRTASPYSYQVTSNPYRAASAAQASAEDAMGWTLSKAWADGSKQEVETFSGAALPAPFASSGANTSSTGKVSTETYAELTLATDQAGHRRVSAADAQGRLTDVWEITAPDSATTGVTFPNHSEIAYGYRTSYSYDILGNLTTVNQGSQTPRHFAYSSLSRLISSQNPESGTTNYQYDANGNLMQKSQLRSGSANVVTAYSYDPLNRLTQRSYSTPNGVPSSYQATPAVTYTYDDPNIDHSRGKLTKVSSLVSTTEYTLFDLLGRVKESRQTTDGTAYNPLSYTYNLSGALVEETYPSGRKVKDTLDASGNLSEVESKKNSTAGYWTYAGSFTYNASGAVTSMQLGNGNWESTQFNSRLQPTQIALGTTAGAANLSRLNYGYGQWESSTLDTAKNNGNVAQQIIKVPTAGSYIDFTQKYEYDSLNRITNATETESQSSSQTWGQAFIYDRYGNRTFDEENTTTLLKKCGDDRIQLVCEGERKVINPSVDPANNRLAAGQDYTYDSAGNTTADPQNRTFIYDAENKQVEVDDHGIPVGKYYYDGDGKRVKKETASEITIFIYDADGKLVAEYSSQLSQDPQVAYLTTDNLGTPRINTNASGAVVSRHDYHPFGDEITEQRMTVGGYEPDEVRKKFTGYEHDQETDLELAGARMYSSGHGRFTEADPILSSGTIYDPQTWNRYSYVLNTPLKYIDPLGMYICKGEAEQCKKIEAGLSAGREALKNLDPNSEQYKLLERALNTYGDAGVENGLTVIIGEPKTKGAPAETTGCAGDRNGDGQKDITEDNPTGRDITLTIDPNQMKDVNDYGIALSHEGSHVADRTALAAALPVDLGTPEADAVFSSSLHLTEYDTETKAYRVSAAAAQGLKYDSLKVGKAKIEIWNSNWRKADLAAEKSKQATRISEHLATPIAQGGLYEVTKDKPGPQLVPKGP